MSWWIPFSELGVLQAFHMSKVDGGSGTTLRFRRVRCKHRGSSFLQIHSKISIGAVRAASRWPFHRWEVRRLEGQEYLEPALRHSKTQDDERPAIP
jgi:hypothetical protein